MGKVKKLKEKRKIERIEKEQKLLKTEELWRKIGLFSVSLFLVFGFVSYGYSNYGAKYASPIVGKIKSGAAKFIGTSPKGSQEVKTYKTAERKYSKAPDMQINKTKKYTAKFETSKGNFTAELYADRAPKTVNNFVVLSKDKFYDGLIFHRIIKDFMIQGGDPNKDGTGDPGYKFEDEKNDVLLERGVLAMANSGPNTNGSQFFIITKDKTDWLQGKHTAFGKVIEGMDVVMGLEKVETGENDKPKEEIKINKITIQEK